MMSNDDEASRQTHLSPFDAIRRESEVYGEYWSARELYKLLGYSRWEKFKSAIQRAQEACKDAGQDVADHFHLEVKMVKLGSGAQRKIEDIYLSRYACYLTLQNADPSGKPIVGLAQTYFAVQTRRQEIADELATLPEEHKRLILRSEMVVLNTRLAAAAQQAGVLEPFDFAIFQDHGYMGLYGGLKARDIHTRKKLGPKDEILDWMGSDELAANAFRASLTRQKLEHDQVQGREKANQTHYQVGRKVRQTIQELGGTVPEELPTPEKSIQQLQYEEQKHLEQRQQPSLFETLPEPDSEQS